MVLLLVLMPAYIIVSFIYAQRRSLDLARQIDAANQLTLSTVIKHPPKRAVLIAAVLGFLYAIAFNVPGNGANLLTTSPPERAVILGQLLIWSMMGCLLYVRIHIARAFRRASESVTVDIFEPSRLRPFAQSALTDVLIIVIGLVLSTVQSLDFSFRPDNYSKALVILVPAIIFLSLYPIWGLHQRMSALRREQLRMLNSRIGDASKALVDADVANLEILLQRRERVSSAATWPIDISILQRFLFYIIIPPLAWIGAALVELLIDGFISG